LFINAPFSAQSSANGLPTRSYVIFVAGRFHASHCLPVSSESLFITLILTPCRIYGIGAARIIHARATALLAGQPLAINIIAVVCVSIQLSGAIRVPRLVRTRA
jgi:hypothetical protein